MPALLSTPAGTAIAVYEFEDDGGSYALRLTWEDRLRAYYVDVVDLDTGEDVARGRRLTPNGLIARLPTGGTLFGYGDRDPYAFEDLGKTLYVAIEFAGEES